MSPRLPHLLRLPRRIASVALLAACAVIALGLVLAGASAGGIESAAVVGSRIDPAAPTQQPPVGAASKKWILVVGDSVIQGLPAYGAVATLQAGLGPAWNRPVIDAAESRSTLAAPSVIKADLQQIAPNTFDTVIVALGYNDGGTASIFESRAKAVLDELHNVRHVYWLTLREFGQFADAYHQSNIGLQSIITAYPNATLLDWNEFSKTLPDSEFTVDGNHLSPNLAQVMAMFIADAVNRKSRYVATGPTATPTSAPPSSTPSNAISTVGAATPPATGEHNSLLIGLLVGAVVAISFAISAWAGSRRMRARESEARRSQWDRMFGIDESEEAEAAEAAEKVDEGDIDEAAAADVATEPTPVDAPLPPRDGIS